MGGVVLAEMQIRDVVLFVKVSGAGRPLLLLHGGPGADHTSMRPFEPLAEAFTLIYLDHRCNGRSVGPDVATMTWENLTADVEALREALGFERWAVLGHSFGGMVAMEYALRYPESLTHLLLVDTCGDSQVYEHIPGVLRERGYSDSAVEAARRFFNGELAPNEVLPAMMKFGKAYYYHLGLFDFVRMMLSGFKVKMRPEAQIYGFRYLLRDWSVMGRLGEIAAPALVLAGRDDFQFPPEHQAALAAGLPNAQLVLINKAGHNAPQERPDAVLPVVRRFLSS